MITTTESELGSEIGLWQLVSPTLPVGAFAWSDGLESAIASGDVADEPGAEAWIGGVLDGALGVVDLPLLTRMHAAWGDGDAAAVRRWSQRLVALRDTAELRASDRQTGRALARLLADLGEGDAREWVDAPHTTLAAMFALACARRGVSARRAAAAYAWSWLENQVAAAIKLVPLGQTAGQRMLARLAGAVERAAVAAAEIDWEDVRGSTLGVSVASAAHEVQYSRLFRS